MRHLPATWSVMYSMFYKRSLGENNPGNTIFRHHLLLLRIMKRKQESLSQSHTSAPSYWCFYDNCQVAQALASTQVRVHVATILRAQLHVPQGMRVRLYANILGSHIYILPIFGEVFGMVQDLKITHMQNRLFTQKTDHLSKWAERANREMDSGGGMQT